MIDVINVNGSIRPVGSTYVNQFMCVLAGDQTALESIIWMVEIARQSMFTTAYTRLQHRLLL